jgi:hypothetical protein
MYGHYLRQKNEGKFVRNVDHDTKNETFSHTEVVNCTKIERSRIGVYYLVNKTELKPFLHQSNEMEDFQIKSLAAFAV